MEFMKFSHLTRSLSRLVAVCTCLAAAMPFLTSNSVAQQVPFLEYSASAYGTFAFVGSTVGTAETAPVSVGGGCGTAQVGETVTGTVASLNALPTVQTGLVNTSGATALNEATASSNVHQINLLGGLIVGDEVEAVSTTSTDNTGFRVSAAGSNLVNLVVAGVAITSVPAPNTKIQLAGFGHVVLNEQIVSGGSSPNRLTVNMIHVYVTAANVLNIKVGTQIIVAHASSGLTEINGPATLDGTAYGTRVAGTLIKSSPTAPVGVGCQGNSLVTNTQLSVNVPNVVTIGTIQDTAQGSVATAQSSAQTTASIQTANLLNGIITVDAIRAQANASTPDGTTFNFSSSGSFVNLSVLGHPEITASVPPNTKVTLTGIGTLYLNRVIQNSNSIQVRMIEVVLSSGNLLGLPTNTDVIVAHASASLHSPAHP